MATLRYIEADISRYSVLALAGKFTNKLPAVLKQPRETSSMIYSTTISSPENLCSFPQGRGVLIRPRPGPLAARRGARRRRGLCHGGEGAPHQTGPGKIAAGRFRAGVADAEGRGARAEGPPLAIPRGRSASAGAPPRPRPLPPPAAPSSACGPWHTRSQAEALRDPPRGGDGLGACRAPAAPPESACAAPTRCPPSGWALQGHREWARLDGPSRAAS